MANFLRDQQITNITIGEDKIRQIGEIFFNRTNTFNGEISEKSDQSKIAILFLTIRFDGKGYRVFNLEELLSYYGLKGVMEPPTHLSIKLEINLFDLVDYIAY